VRVRVLALSRRERARAKRAGEGVLESDEEDDED
jgi:hypothetical protein